MQVSTNLEALGWCEIAAFIQFVRCLLLYFISLILQVEVTAFHFLSLRQALELIHLAKESLSCIEIKLRPIGELLCLNLMLRNVMNELFYRLLFDPYLFKPFKFLLIVT